MLKLAQKDLAIVLEILNRLAPDCEVYAFGSRIDGTAKEFSDLDLLLIGSKKIDRKRIEKIKDAFSESELPMIVDLIDWHAISPEFQAIITKKRELLRNKLI